MSTDGTAMSAYQKLVTSIPTDADRAATAGYRQGWGDGWKAAMAARDAREAKAT